MRRSRLLSFLLVFVLVFQTVRVPGVASLTAYAAEDTQEESTEEPAAENGDAAQEEPAADDDAQDAEETPAAEGDAQDTEEEPAAEDGAQDAEEEPAPGEDAPEAGEDADNTPDPAGEDTSAEDAPAADFDLPEGVSGMPEGYRLTEQELRIKQNAAEHDIVSDVLRATEGEDYLSNEVVCLAETEEHAALIAEAYGAELSAFVEGVAVFTLDPEVLTVEEAVAIGADPANNMVTVEPNYCWEIGEPSVQTSDRLMSAAAVAVPEETGWEDWGQNDPWLNPANGSYQWMHDMINSYGAWGVTTGRQTVTVAVLDTGFAPAQNEFAGRVSFYDTTGAGKGQNDPDGHGTHVAGIVAAARGNTVDGAGVAPGVNILACGVEGSFTLQRILSGINYIAGSGPSSRRADIVNMSFGGPSYNASLEAGLDNLYKSGVTVVAAMGNENANNLAWPVAYKNVISVCAVDPSGQRAGFSTYGNYADIAAPGVDIWSTGITADRNDCLMSGTSMASPVVAGACALYMSAYGHVDPDTMRKVLKRSVNKAGSPGLGAGIIDVSKMFAPDMKPPQVQMLGAGNAELGKAASGKSATVKGTVSPADKIVLTAGSFVGGAGDQRGKLIYTTDGKAPVVQDGVLQNGQIYNAAMDAGALAKVKAGKQTVTIKAAYVSGMGAVSKPTTLKYTVDFGLEQVSISGAPKILIAGKSVTLTATGRATGKKQNVRWSVTPENAGVTVHATSGKVTAKAGTNGSFTVNCFATNGKTLLQSVSFTVTDKLLPASKMKVAPAEGTVLPLKYTANAPGTVTVSVTELTDAKGNDLRTVGHAFQWTSANTKVLALQSVSGDGRSATFALTGKGSAKVTAKVLDGSGKSASCTIKADQLIERLTISGQSYVAQGTQATYKVSAVVPAKTSTKGLQWKADTTDPGITISGGTLKVAKDVPAGTQFAVYALAGDGSGVTSNRITVTVTASKITAVSVRPVNYASNYQQKFDKKGSLTSLQLFTVNTPNYAVNETQLSLKAELKAGEAVVGDLPLWTSSNDKVVKIVSGTGTNQITIQAVGKGTANIVCAAQDGSGKKATIKVSVIVPVSGITPVSPSFYSTNARYPVAYGRSMQTKVAYGSAYGTPSNKKVTWSVDYVDSSMNVITDPAVKNIGKKLIKLSNGKLTVPSQAAIKKLKTADRSAFNRINYIVVKATAADGSGFTGSIYYRAVPPTTYIQVGKSNSYYITRYQMERELGQPVYTDGMSGFAVKSSNPKVVSAYYKDGYLWVTGHKAGSAKITLTALDGTGKKKTIKIQVRK